MLDVVLPIIFLALLLVFLWNAPSWHVKQPLRRGVLSTYRLAPRRHWLVERDGITISATTTTLNPLPKRIVTRIEKFGYAARDKAKRFYDAGVVLGAVGSGVAVTGALWAWARAWLAVWHEAEAHARTQSTTVSHVLKRALTEQPKMAVPVPHSSSGGIQPLVRVM
jgi:hypothetical protein